MFSEELWIYYKLQTRAQLSYGSGTQVSIQTSIMIVHIVKLGKLVDQMFILYLLNVTITVVIAGL